MEMIEEDFVAVLNDTIISVAEYIEMLFI